MGQLLDRTVTVKSSGVTGTVYDVAMEQARTRDWVISRVAVQEPAKGLRQLLEADLVYVRDFTRAQNMTAEQWKHLALIAHHCYGSVDLTARAINMLTQLGEVPGDANRRYFASLPSPPSGKPA